MLHVSANRTRQTSREVITDRQIRQIRPGVLGFVFSVDLQEMKAVAMEAALLPLFLFLHLCFL